MPSSSDSIAQLAAALAKAQIELVNPAKTMTGVIDRWGTGNEGQTYRYAPLSAGLDIVRQTLCKHELAVIQTTDLDRQSGMVMLTTTLAHGSGEWISASWPVCRTAEMTNPKLMGAALTYARRYGLFTLVGIAGEDDLDAPEILATSVASATPERAMVEPATRKGNGSEDRSLHDGEHRAGETGAPPGSPMQRLRPVLANGRKKRSDAGVPRGPRAPAGSVEIALRDLYRIEDPDTLFAWALRVLPLRNTLPDSARATLDAAFFEKADEVDTDPELLIALDRSRAPPDEQAPLPQA